MTLVVPAYPLRVRHSQRLRKLSYESRMSMTTLHIILIGSLLPLLRIAICKTGVVHRRDVAKVAHDIHHFVIAEQAHDSPAGLWRFLFERHHQIHHIAGFRATIQEVPDLDESSLAPGPVMLVIE